MGSLLVILLLLVVAASVAVGISTWASTKSATVRNIVGFCLCAAAAYCVGFVVNIWVLAAIGTIPTGNVIAPTFTWMVIALACLFAAFRAGSSPLALGSPFFLNALLAFLFSPSVSETLIVAGSLVVVGIAVLLGRRPFVNAAKVPIGPSFPVGEYRLDGAISQLTDLVEFSPAQYSAMGRQFEGEIDYNARPTWFLDRSWKVNLQSVNGKICKIAPYLVCKEKQEASQIAMRALQYCREHLGQPVEQQTGLFVWDATDGNVILQTNETHEGWLVSLFLTSRSIRNLQRA